MHFANTFTFRAGRRAQHAVPLRIWKVLRKSPALSKRQKTMMRTFLLLTFTANYPSFQQLFSAA